MNREDIIARVSKLYVAAVSDAADRVGVGPVCMDSGIRPLTKIKRVAGFARTGKLVRAPPGHPYDEAQLDRFMTLATRACDGDVVVMTAVGAYDCSVWGQVLTRIGLKRGLRGAVVDGTSRDIADIDRLGFAVFARGRHPGTMRGRLNVESVGEPVMCGGILVHPGDLVFGDGDGVVVIPRDHIDDVLGAAEDTVSVDRWWAEKLEEGRDPHEMHKEKPIP
ncbi:MAG: RraA family protein [Candidatus Thorarchaeota archaeon]